MERGNEEYSDKRWEAGKYESLEIELSWVHFQTPHSNDREDRLGQMRGTITLSEITSGRRTSLRWIRRIPVQSLLVSKQQRGMMWYFDFLICKITLRYLIYVVSHNNFGTSIPSVLLVTDTNIERLSINGSVIDTTGEYCCWPRKTARTWTLSACCANNGVTASCAENVCDVEKGITDKETVITDCAEQWNKVSDPSLYESKSMGNCYNRQSNTGLSMHRKRPKPLRMLFPKRRERYLSSHLRRIHEDSRIPR